MIDSDVDSFLRRMRERDDPFEQTKKRNYHRIGSRYDGV